MGAQHWKALDTGTSQALTGGVEGADGEPGAGGNGRGRGDVEATGKLVTRIREDRQNLAAVAAVSEGGKALVLLAQNGRAARNRSEIAAAK